MVIQMYNGMTLLCNMCAVDNQPNRSLVFICKFNFEMTLCMIYAVYFLIIDASFSSFWKMTDQMALLRCFIFVF